MPQATSSSVEACRSSSSASLATSQQEARALAAQLEQAQEGLMASISGQHAHDVGLADRLATISTHAAQQLTGAVGGLGVEQLCMQVRLRVRQLCMRVRLAGWE